MDENLIKHIFHPFYKKVDKLVNDVRLMQLRKGAEKYPEPFTPSSWTGKELAIHALQELRDGQVYVVGMLERIEELEGERNKYLRWWKDEARLADKYMEQNKRYRETMKKAMKELDTPGMTKINAYRILSFALEGTK